MGLFRRGETKRAGNPSFVTAASVYIDRPPEQVWDFVYEPANEPLYVKPAVRGFFVPGTPRRTTGEQRCLFVLNVAGPWKGAIGVFAQELIDVQWGVRLAIREMSVLRPYERIFTLEPVGRGCGLVLELQIDTDAGHNQDLPRSFGDWLPAALHRIKKSVESAAEPPAHEIPSRWPETGRTASVVTSHSADIAVPADTLWGLITDPASALNHGVGRQTFTLPGSPVDQVGEISCLLRHKEGRLTGEAYRRVALDPGRLSISEGLTSRYPFKGTTLVEPTRIGCRLHVEFETLVPRREKEQLIRSDRETLTRNIERVKELAERS